MFFNYDASPNKQTGKQSDMTASLLELLVAAEIKGDLTVKLTGKVTSSLH